MADQEQNGPTKPQLAVTVVLNTELQKPLLGFDKTVLTDWDLVVGILEMGLNEAKFQQNLGRMRAMQALAEAEALQARQAAEQVATIKRRAVC